MARGVLHGVLLHGIVEVAAQAHIDHIGTGLYGGADALGNGPLVAGAVGIQNPDTQDADIGSDARAADAIVHGGGDDAGNVGAVTVLVTGSHTDVNLPDLSGKIGVICLYTGVQNGNGDVIPAGGYAPGGVGVHNVVGILIVAGVVVRAGVQQEGIGIVHILLYPGAPGLLRGGSGVEGRGTALARGDGVQMNDVVGIGCGQGKVHILRGGHRFGNRGGLQADFRHAAGVGHQLRTEGLREKLGFLFGVGVEYQNAVLVIRTGIQGSGGLGYVMVGHVQLVG